MAQGTPNFTMKSSGVITGTGDPANPVASRVTIHDAAQAFAADYLSGEEIIYR